MLYLKSLANVIDNSGALVVECIKVLRKGPKSPATVGDRIVCVVKKAKPVPQTLTGPAAQNRLRKGDIRHGVVVRVKAPVQRPDGSVIKFDDNAVVLLNKGTTEPVGTRISSVIAREVKEKGFAKIVTLAPRTV